MTLIELEFSSEAMVMHGKMCCVTCDTPMGEIGDEFIVRDRLYQIIDIKECTAYKVGSLFRLEGFTTLPDFFQHLHQKYPELDAEDLVYVHYFAFMGEECKVSAKICPVMRQTIKCPRHDVHRSGEKLGRARGPMKHLKVDKQIDCCYLCYWFKEDMETGDIYENCIHPDFTEPKSIWGGSKIPEWCPLSEVA